MKKFVLFCLLCLVIIGCQPSRENTKMMIVGSIVKAQKAIGIPAEKAKETMGKPIAATSNSFFKEEGWSTSGYTWKKDGQKLKLGIIGSDLLYEECQKEDRHKLLEEDLKDSWYFGFFFSKEF